MDFKFLHFYPDLMSLYGSWANLAILKRHLEDLGNTVTVEPIVPGGEADFTHGDFVYMGAGTERSAKAALADFRRFAPAIHAAAQRDCPMLFAGTAMSLLGASVTDDWEIPQQASVLGHLPPGKRSAGSWGMCTAKPPCMRLPWWALSTNAPWFPA